MIAALTIVAMTVVSAGAPGGERPPAVRGLLQPAAEAPPPPVGPDPDTVNVPQVLANVFTDLKAGWRLGAGESLFSALGGFRLTMQDDGNLVLYVIDDMKLPLDILHVISGAPDALKLYAAPIWSTGTHVPKAGKSRGRHCVMEENGNLVVYDHDRHSVFETGTGGHPGSFLRLQTDGNLVVYTSDLKPIWASNTAARLSGAGEIKVPQGRVPGLVHAIRGLPAQLSMDLRPRWRLNTGDSLYSPLGGFWLFFQVDGNLVLYVVDDERIPGDVAPILLHTAEWPSLYHNALWSTGTHVPTQAAGTGAYCIMKDDGNFVVYDEDDKPCFQSGTKGHPGAFLRCQDDGNLVIYTRDKKPIWQSKTYARIVDNPVPKRR